MPVSRLKVDGSFVSRIDEDGRNDEIVCAIVTLARNLKLKVIAEGVETQAQLRKLRTLECESGQGFLFAKPMAIERLQEFLVENSYIEFGQARFEDVETLSLVQ